MIRTERRRQNQSFSLVEVVMAIGVVSFSVLATVGLLSVASDTNKKSRDEGNAARIALNEFERLRSIGAPNFPTAAYSRYYDNDLRELSNQQGAIYSLSINLVAAPAGTADLILNAEVRYPAQAATSNQSVYRFTALINNPTP
jgi:type II secretory pathway pseudopilin PulG